MCAAAGRSGAGFFIWRGAESERLAFADVNAFIAAMIRDVGQ